MNELPICLRHFGTSAEVGDFGTNSKKVRHFGTKDTVPNCLRSEVSLVRSVRTPEERQRELTACNIIIYNVPEPENNNKTEREQTVTDFCLDMFSNLLKVIVSYTDVKKMMHLGKYNSIATAVRPLLIQF